MTPTDSQLRRFLIGTLPAADAAGVADWLECDPHAAAILERVQVSDPLAGALAEMGSAVPARHAGTVRFTPLALAPVEAAAGAQPGRFRIAVGGATGTTNAADLCEQLRQRLRFVAFAATVGCALCVAKQLTLTFTEIFRSAWTWSQEQTDFAEFVFLLPIQLVFVWLLAKRTGTTLQRMRTIEMLLFLSFCTYFSNCEIQALYRHRDTALDQWTWTLLGEGLAIPCVVVVVGYGVLIPNPWRRCAVGVALISLVSYLSAAVGFGVAGQSDQVIQDHFLTRTIWLWLAGGIVVYGAYRIELLRASASAARQLGQYRLTERLGGGGMGVVYLAEHALLKRPCAVKLIRSDRADNPDTLARFEREVQATAALAHPHIVRIFDYGRADDGTFYCVMERLAGITLNDLVERHGPVPAGRAVFLLRQLCSALAEAHEHELTHRDVKPNNVIVRDRDRQADFAVLLDFGLVDDANGEDGKLTVEGAVMGTPSYMAPEQAAGETADHRADVYAVGAVGYFLLSGRPPFDASSKNRIMAAVLHQPPEPLAGCHPGLWRVIARCLAKAPAERFASADDLDDALATSGCSGWSHREAEQWWAAHHQREGGPVEAV